jgi:hypothetical protein
MIRRLGLEDAGIETPQFGAAAATTPARPVPQPPAPATVTPAAEPRRAPTLVTPRQILDLEDVMEWDANAVYCHPTNPDIAQCQSTASRLKAAITTAGTKARQAVVIHEYCTKVDPVLGQILQMVEDPERSRRVGEQTKHLMKQFLHSKSVYRTTNKARSFHLTVFKAMVPPHPKDDASRRTKELFQKKMKEFANEFDLSPCMKKAALVASIHRRDYKLNPARNQPVMEHYKRRSPYNTKVTLELKRQFIDWCINLSDTVVCSPDKKDVMIARDLETGEKIKDETDSPKEWVYQRKYKYKGSLNRLYQEAIQPQAQGGFPGFRDKNGEVWIGRSSFDKCIPGYFSRLTDSQKRGCECTSCLNGEFMMAGRLCKLAEV